MTNIDVTKYGTIHAMRIRVCVKRAFVALNFIKYNERRNESNHICVFDSNRNCHLLTLNKVFAILQKYLKKNSNVIVDIVILTQHVRVPFAIFNRNVNDHNLPRAYVCLCAVSVCAQKNWLVFLVNVFVVVTQTFRI